MPSKPERKSDLASPAAGQTGFTLIELMIVVGIIGILVSVATPMFNRYQRKARQSEAKIAVASMFSLEKSFYSEYSAYAASFDAIGFASEGQKRFYYTQITADAVAYTGTITGYSGSLGTPWISSLNSPYPWGGSYQAAGANCNWGIGGASIGNDPQSFVGIAQGNLYTPAGFVDCWTMNQLKILSNCSNGT